MSCADLKNKKCSFAGALFKGKRVVVTGASRGIGRACALAFGHLEADLGVLSRQPAGLEKLLLDLEEISPSLRVVDQAVDVADSEALKECLIAVKEKLGGVDILVNNAGIYMTEAVEGHDLDVWLKTMNTNLTSAMVASSTLLPGMVAQNWGRVINISSISGKHAEAYGAAYSASKFGLIGLTESMALETARFGVTVNAVCPGWVATDMAMDQINDPRWCQMNEIDPGQSLEIARLSVPQERLIEPQEVASLVVYLCTDDARGITGQAINICGGLSVH